MARELAKAYDPKEVERRVYEFWRGRRDFEPPAEPRGKPFSITIPPPNVTGELHMGHALQHAIHDLILRRKRMQGFDTLCVPGTDHAGISTNIKVEQALRAEGETRWSVGRERFVERAKEWTLKYGGAILGQLEALGCSYDWSRTRFTLDEFVEVGPETAGWALNRLYTRSGYARAVLGAFARFYERGWIYRAERIVNWCPQCQTTLSELEMEYRDVSSHLWHFRYPASDGGEGLGVATTLEGIAEERFRAPSEGLVVATTRPETMLGDTGVAVNPSDARYAHLVGKTVRLPLMERDIPVVADHHVDATFGSGAVKVTPAHDPNDWEIAQRHPDLLPALKVLDDQGNTTEAAGPYAGLDRREARKRVVEDLEKRGLLVKVEEYTHSVGHHDKCGTVIEPLLKLQWWARCDELAAKTIRAIKERRVTFLPERFTQMETEWLWNIRPWCVSRQQWWGHRIPLYYCRACDAENLVFAGPDSEQAGELINVLEGARPIPSVAPPAACPRCGASEIVQDPDVLDTWFSSALWPHATLGWPEETEDLSRFYPTDLMITGRDILYLWVARMIMTGEEFLGREPFREVLVHATVMTEDGKRMSKSLGTGVDPLALIRLYGADATRFGLTSLATESQDIRFKMQWASGGKAAKGPDDQLARAEQIEQMRNFCNKIWNISRFVLLNLGERPSDLRPFTELAADPTLELADRWILSRYGAAVAAVNEALDRHALGEASWALYHFVWDEFADWYVELVKPRLRGEGAPTEAARSVLLAVLEGTLRLAHPFLPFITEEVWQSLPRVPEGAALIRQKYPEPIPALADAEAESRLAEVMEVCRVARNLKAELGVPTRPVDLHVTGPDELHAPYVEAMARVRVLREAATGPTARALAGGYELAISREGLVDPAVEQARMRKDLETAKKELAGLEARLGNPQFAERAPTAVVEKAEAQRDELRERIAKLEERLPPASREE